MICPHCQLANAEDAYFCKKCGLNLHMLSIQKTAGLIKTKVTTGKLSKSFFKAILIPICIAVINAGAQPLYALVPHPAGNIIFNAVRIVLYFWAGFIITVQGIGALCLSAKAGAVMLFIDHVIVRGGLFLLFTAIGKVSIKDGLMSFGGVIISYVMFAWIAALLGVLGGLSGRRVYNKKKGTA